VSTINNFNASNLFLPSFLSPYYWLRHITWHETSFLQHIKSFNIHYSSFQQTLSPTSIDTIQQAVSRKFFCLYGCEDWNTVIEEIQKLQAKRIEFNENLEKDGKQYVGEIKRQRTGKEKVIRGIIARHNIEIGEEDNLCSKSACKDLVKIMRWMVFTF
jgi:hypothetical protein